MESQVAALRQRVADLKAKPLVTQPAMPQAAQSELQPTIEGDPWWYDPLAIGPTVDEGSSADFQVQRGARLDNKSERVEQRNDNGRHDGQAIGECRQPRSTQHVRSFGSHRFSAASWVLDLHISRSRCNRSARRASAVRNTSGDDTVCTSHHRVSWQAR